MTLVEIKLTEKLFDFNCNTQEIKEIKIETTT